MSDALNPQNYQPAQTQMDLEDTLAAWKHSIFYELNCHAIATVQTVDTTRRVLSAKMNYVKTYYRENAEGQLAAYTATYADLIDCPYLVMGGGAASLTFPIKAGDTCLILFNDRDIDNWFAGAPPASPVATGRMHNFSDGLALVGFPSSSAVFDAARALLQNGQTGVGVSSTKVKIYNATTTLNTQLQALLTNLETFANACSAASTVAQIATAAGTLNSALSTLATNLGNLLE